MDEFEQKFFEEGIKSCLRELKKLEKARKELRLVIFAYKQMLKGVKR